MNGSPARYVMLGGFLGAGKTTSLIYLAKHLQDAGKRVGIITNDQAASLVDTAVVQSQAVPVQEIAGGCFCCRFPSLQAAADVLEAEARPEVFLGEPVGSCTDLVATVSYPLRRLYGGRFVIAPLSVLLDAKRALRMLDLQNGKRFSEKVRYIYLKQIEEAHALVINKIDLITPDERQALDNYLRKTYPQKRLFYCSALSGTGMCDWIDWVLSHEIGDGRQMHVDYQTYAEGEAALAWCNSAVQLTSEQEFDGNAYLAALMEALRTALIAHGGEIAHLKTTLSPEDGSGEIASANVVDNETQTALRQQLLDPLQSGSLTINIRAESEPDILQHIIPEALANLQRTHAVAFQLDDVEAFRPAPPVPVHRMASMSEDLS